MALFGSFDSPENEAKFPPKADDGEIKNYEMTEKLLYPYLLLECENTLPAHKMRVLKNSLEDLPYIHNEVKEGYYDVVLRAGKLVMIMGMVHTDNLKVILQSSLFSDLDKSLCLSPYEIVKGNMMYAFCTSQIY